MSCKALKTAGWREESYFDRSEDMEEHVTVIPNDASTTRQKAMVLVNISGSEVGFFFNGRNGGY